MLKRAILAGAMLIAAAPASAAEAKRVEAVRFAPGTSTTVIKGSIKGYETAAYRIDLRAGQTLSVGIKTSNRSNYFNIQPPGDGAALFTGAMSGDRFSGKIATGGPHTILVFLMRNAARRNERAQYSVSVTVK